MADRRGRWRNIGRTGDSFIVIAGVLTLVLLGGTDSPTSARPLSVAVSQKVRDRLQREGTARVIVRLRLSVGAYITERHLPSAAAVAGQRRDLAAAATHVLSRLQGRAHRILRRYHTVPFVALEVGPAALAELEASGLHVEHVGEDTLARPTLTESVPLVEGDQAWADGYDGAGTVVAILDTGIDTSHPFLIGKVVEEACFSSTVPGRSASLCPSGMNEETGPGSGINCSFDRCYHGTHVAGIVAGSASDPQQPAGGVAKGAQVMSIQVFSRFDSATTCGGSPPCVLTWTSDQMAALEAVYELRGRYNFAAVNMSLGGEAVPGTCDFEPRKVLIDNLRSVGIVTVIASGNDGDTDAISVPACVSSAVSVGATNNDDEVAGFSNVAPLLSFLAPGTSIYSSLPDGSFGYASGTSMATPHVSGAWAILKQAAPSATVTDILTALETTGLPIPDTRPGGTVTTPRIRIHHALAALSGAGPALAVDTTNVAPGSLITVTLTNGRAGPTDWLALATVGAPDTSYHDWTYVGAGTTTRTWIVPAPDVAGEYEFRLYLNDGPDRAATSAKVTVN